MSPPFIKRLGLLVLALSAVAFLISALAAPTKEELADAAQWVDGLDWPDLRGKAYVELTFGKFSDGVKMKDGPKMRGFLLAEDAQSWTIFCDGSGATRDYFGGAAAAEWPMTTAQYSKPKPDTPARAQTSIRPVALREAVDARLGDLRRREEKDDNFESPRFGERIQEKTALFLLARCCVRQQQPALAQRLEEAVLRLEARERASRETLPQTLESDLATAFMWKAVVHFGIPSIGRPQLLTEFEQVLRHFPASKHAARAREYAEQLRPIVAEDKAHVAPAQPLEQLSREEQVREWIFRLRDQNGQQITQPGACDVFGGDYGNGANSPALHLVELRYAAVPALLEALADPRPTRSVGYHRDFHFSHYVLTIGDCAAAVLSRISGERFRIAREPFDAMQKEGDSTPVREAAKQWWSRIQAKGEKAVLIENVSAGGPDSGSQATRLAELDPAAAVQAIEAGLAAAQFDRVKSGLVEALARITSEAATASLEKQMRDGASVEARLIAARAVFRRGGKEAIPLMMVEWDKWKPAAGHDFFNERTESALVAFLATCDEPAAMKALATRFPTLPVEGKIRVINALAKSGGSSERVREKGNDAPPEIQALSEELLIGALEDRTAYYGLSGTRFGPGGPFLYRDPRVCDLAGYVLTGNWPDRYRADWSGLEREREIRIIELRNVWRAARGEAALPVPRLPLHAAAAREPNTVAAVQWTGGAALRDFPIVAGRPLTGDQVAAALAQLQRELPKEHAGFSFLAERPGTPHGFVVEIRWDGDPTPERLVSWRTSVDISLGHETLRGQSSAGVQQSRNESDFAGEKESAQIALAGEKKQTLTILYRGKWSSK